MQVVILVGGRGARLLPLTNKMPKPMIPVHGKPFLEYLLRFIKSLDFTEVMLLVGYLGNRIEKYFSNGANFGLEIRYSYEKKLLGTAGALRKAEDKLSKEFLLLNGDTFLPIDYNKLARYFHRHNKMGVVTAYNNYEQIVPNNLAIGKENYILDYNKKDPYGKTHVDAGVMVFKREVLNIIPDSYVYSLENDVFPELIRRKQLLAYPSSQRFYDIGTPEGLKVINEVLR